MTDKATVYPVAMSAGGDNTHSVWCNQLQQQKAYAACIHVNARNSEGKLSEAYSECATAIRRGYCEAVKMREKEKEAGEALFYVPRVKPTNVTKSDKSSLSYAKGWNLVGGSKAEDLPAPSVHHKPTAPKPASKPKKPDLDEMDYGKVVEKMAEAEREAAETGKPVVTATQKPKQKPKKAAARKVKPATGGSLLDIARRQSQRK